MVSMNRLPVQIRPLLARHADEQLDALALTQGVVAGRLLANSATGPSASGQARPLLAPERL